LYSRRLTLMMFVIVRRTVLSAICLTAAYGVMRQCRKPSGWLGRRLAGAMNIGHGALTLWGLEGVPIQADWRILDVGCGGGQTIRRLAAKASTGHVSGIDYSDASVAVARRTNAGVIEAGRVDVQQGSVSHLPYPDAAFDLVTAVETHYYWPDLPSNLREILRVLKPGGRFVLIAEAFKGRRADWLYAPVMRLLLSATYLTLAEHRQVLAAAGFTDVEVRSNASRGWMCASGRRPA